MSCFDKTMCFFGKIMFRYGNYFLLREIWYVSGVYWWISRHRHVTFRENVDRLKGSMLHFNAFFFVLEKICAF